MEDILHKVYYNPDSPAAYSGINNVFKEAKKLYPNLKVGDVNNWLAKQETYHLHKQIKYKYNRVRITVGRIDEQWQIDLMDMQQLGKYNDDHKWILTAIDVFSRQLMAEKVKSKHAKNVSEAFAKMIVNRKPQFCQSDKGGEFKGEFLTLLRKNNIKK